MNQAKSMIGNAIKRVNLAHLIDEMEKQQEIAYKLEHMNNENMEEVKRKELVNKAWKECMVLLKEHLDGFLLNSPDAVYEDWIKHLHPDNVDVDDDDDDDDEDRIDHRFYHGKLGL